MTPNLCYTQLMLSMPAMTAFVCLVFVSLHGNRNDPAKKTDKKVLTAYFALALLCWAYWLMLLLTGQSTFILNPSLGYSLNMLLPLLFYHAVYRLTSVSAKSQFPIHYAIAASLVIVFFALGEWYSSRGPDQLHGFARRAALAYPRIKAVIGGAYKLTYVLLAIYRIAIYKGILLHRIGGEKGYGNFTIALMCVFTIIGVFVPVGLYEIDRIPAVMILTLSVMAVWKYIYIGYKWVYYCTSPDVPFTPPQNESNAPTDAKYMTSKQKFEHYVNSEKPFLNPKLRIEDVARGLNTNRTYVSTFINETYGMNFSAYMNYRRIDEFERLMADPANASLSKYDLAIKAGFGSYRNSTRVRKHLQSEEEESD